MWSKILAHFKRFNAPVNTENVVCANCETRFSGNYCPNCGQAIREYDKPIGFILYNFLGDFFAFDMRFFKTLVVLIFRPGYLSTEYVEGRRVKFAPPFRVFIFVSFIMFLFLQIYTNRGLNTFLDSGTNEAKLGMDSVALQMADSIYGEVQSELNENEKVAADLLLNKMTAIDSVDDNNDNLSINVKTYRDKQNFKINLKTFRDAPDFRHGLNNYATGLEQELEQEKDPDKRVKLRGYIRLCRSPEHAVAEILKYISWAFFLLLPLFALILKLVYIRRKQNYMRHLIFSIHIHSFIFIVMTFVVGMYLLGSKNMEMLIATLVFVVPVYIVIAMKKFYGQNIGKTILKFFVVSYLYNLIFLIVVIVASLNAVNIL
jgi:hypothetical protein